MAVKKVARKESRRSDVAAAMKLIDQLMAETEPRLTLDLPAVIETKLTGSSADAVNRRMALHYLTKPFHETAKMIYDDRETAVAFASMAVCIRSSLPKYRALVEFLTAAETRVSLALCRRDDMDEVIAEAGHG